MKYFLERLYDNYGQQFKIDKVYFQNNTDHQDLLIFHNAKFGRVMTLDGVVQTTEKDEFIYHEMLTHVPIMAHGKVKKVLIIGGGDGGMLREVLTHQSIEQVIQVEIDEAVITMSKNYLPNHSQGAFADPRATIVIADGIHFVKTTDEKFDVIISDSTDPLGPGEALFTKEFYAACCRCLNPDGILVTQNGVAFEQLDEAVNSAKSFQTLFNDWHFYSAAVPTYVGGIMLFGFASNQTQHRQHSLETIQSRWQSLDIKTRYYNPEIHLGSFALPQYVLEAIGKDVNAK